MTKAQCIGFLNTPPLWEDTQFGIPQFIFPKTDLQAFRATDTPSNIRLGHQMEHVFTQLVTYSGEYEVVLNNLPISRNKITLGEIDYILKDRSSNKLIHVELTYKFYIIDPSIQEPIHQLIGPNRRDSFFDKKEKIKNRQFTLLHSEEGAKALSDQNIDHFKIEHQCCFKAQLFQPYNNKTVYLGTLNKDCLTGYWFRIDDFNRSEFIDAQFYIPTKSEWVIEPHIQVAWQSHSEIMIDINLSLSEKRAPMIWIKRSTNEYEKCFVVWW